MARKLDIIETIKSGFWKGPLRPLIGIKRPKISTVVDIIYITPNI